MARAATQPAAVVHPRYVVHTTWRDAPVTLYPHHRLRANHPLVKQAGPDAFEPERPLDFEE